MRPTVWPQYTNVTNRQDRQTGQRSNSIHKPFHKRSPKNAAAVVFRTLLYIAADETAIWANAVIKGIAGMKAYTPVL